MQGVLIHYQLLYLPIIIVSPTYYPQNPSSEPIVPFLLGIFIISQLSSGQTVHSLILRHNHSLHSSSHQKRVYFPFKKGYFIISFYPTPSLDPSLQFISPPHHFIPLSPFRLKFPLSVNFHQSKQFIHYSYVIIISYIYLPISREPIMSVKNNYFIVSCYPTSPIESSLQFIIPTPSSEIISPFIGNFHYH